MAILLTNITWQVRQGESLGRAFDAQPASFPPIYRALVREGESSGTLHSCLLRNAELLERQQQLGQKCVLAFSYPLIVALVGVLSGLAAIRIMAPLLEETFSNHAALPISTRILLTFAQLSNSGWFVLIFLCCLILAGYQLVRKLATAEGQLIRDRYLLRIPVLGRLLKLAALIRIAQTLSTACRSGLPLTQGLEHCADVAGNEVFRLDLLQAKSALIQGMPLERYFGKRRDLYTPAFVAVVASGVEAGSLDDSLCCLERLLGYELDGDLESGLALVQPLLLGCTGLLIAFLSMAVLLPIYGMVGQ
jgi:general secretion pathway protein F